MDLKRRDALAFASAAGALALAEPLLALAPSRPAPGALGEVVRRLTAFAEAELADNGFPGMAVALIAPGGAEATFAVGFADLGRRIPALPGQLFQIGSITKSLTAMALFVLAERGKVDLDARIGDLLPEFPLPPEPITLTQLLEHSSGLPNSLEEPALLQLPGNRLWTGFAPGTRYSYCNLGYALLGAAIEKVSGMPWSVALEALVLKPLGMATALPVVRTADRAAFASGHIRLREDMPWLPRAPLARARWFDFATAAGSVAAGAADMVRYLRFLSALAQGRGAPLFSDVLAARFRTPTIDSAPAGARYGNGLHTLVVEDRLCFRHTGGVHGFSSAVTLDREAGLGCYASVNVGGAGGYRPTEITEYALPLLRAAVTGGPLPPRRLPRPAPAVRDGARFTGTWLSTDGVSIGISERRGRLFVTCGGIERPLRPGGDTGFFTDHPRLDPYVLVFEDESSRLRLGARLFGRGSAPPAQPVSPRLAGLAGTYHSPRSWGSRPRVFALGTRLFVNTEEVVEAPDGSWRFTSPALASERAWFQNLVGGRAQVLNLSGTPHGRVENRSL